MEQMKKLEDIPRKNVFEVPEGYFDRLPGIIQARVAEKENSHAWSPYFRYSLQYALPALILVVASIFYFRTPEALSVQDLLASVDSEQLVAYLGESDLNTDELLEFVSLDPNEVAAIQESSLDEIGLSDEDVDGLSDEFGNDNN